MMLTTGIMAFFNAWRMTTIHPVAAGDVVTGALSVPPVSLDDPTVLGAVADMEFGRFINLTSGTNFIHNAPRRSQIPLSPADNDGDPAVQPTLDPIGRRLGLRANSVQELLHGRTMTFQ